MERDKTGRPGHTQDGWAPLNEGYQPPQRNNRGHQPTFAPGKPDAGHQPSAPGERPAPPTTGSGVKPPKKP